MKGTNFELPLVVIITVLWLAWYAEGIICR